MATNQDYPDVKLYSMLIAKYCYTKMELEDFARQRCRFDISFKNKHGVFGGNVITREFIRSLKDTKEYLEYWKFKLNKVKEVWIVRIHDSSVLEKIVIDFASV